MKTTVNRSSKRIGNRKNKTLKQSKIRIRKITGGHSDKEIDDFISIVKPILQPYEIDNIKRKLKENKSFAEIIDEKCLLQKVIEVGIVHDFLYDKKHDKKQILEDTKQKLKILLDLGGNINIQQRGCRETPLHLAIRYSFYLSEYIVELIKFLLDNGANFSINTEDGMTTFHMVCVLTNDKKDILTKRKHIALIELFLEKGVDIDIRDSRGLTVLHNACNNDSDNDIEFIEYLIDKGADVNLPNSEGETPLIIAINNGNLELVKLLLDKGADVNLPNSEGETPLHLAINNGNLELVELLLDKGADVNIPNSKGRTPLLIAAKKGYNKIVQLLIKKVYADVNASYKDGNTLLHIAAMNNHIELVFKLIEKGANMNIKNKKGKTPLQYMDPIYSQLFRNEHHVYELREYKGYQVPITIIPKGTLLFRKTEQPEGDFCGIPKSDNNSYCLNKNFNVFFYPYPAYWGDKFKIYVVEDNLKIVNLIYPSHLTREDKYNEDYDFLKDCVKAEPNFCGDLKGNEYDPCLSEEFLEANPDINGMIAMAALDTEGSDGNQGLYTQLNNYSLFHKDNKGLEGIPEIILYPKQQRMLEDQNWSLDECSTKPNNYSFLFDGMEIPVDTIKKKIGQFSVPNSFKEYTDPKTGKIFLHNPITNKSIWKSDFVSTNEMPEKPNIMELLLSPKGYKIKRNPGEPQHPFVQSKFDTIHVTIYNPLKMYVVWEYLPEEYKKHCVPIILSAKSKLSQFQRDINKLNEGLYQTSFTTYDKFSKRGGKTKRKTRKNKKIRKTRK